VKKENLVDEIGDFLLESLHHIHQSLDLVANMRINNTLSADDELVCVAVGIDFLLWMLFAADDRGLHLALQRLLH